MDEKMRVSETPTREKEVLFGEKETLIKGEGGNNILAFKKGLNLIGGFTG